MAMAMPSLQKEKMKNTKKLKILKKTFEKKEKINKHVAMPPLQEGWGCGGLSTPKGLEVVSATHK